MTPDRDDGDDSSQDRTQGDFEIGDTVIDREQDDSDTAVVVNRPPMAAEDWEAYQVSGEPVTVADDNPEYDPTSEVIVVMFLADLDEWGADWDGEKPLALDDVPKGIDYAFPPARLKPVGTYSPTNTTETAEKEEADTTDETTESATEQTQEITETEDITADEDAPEQTQEGATEETSTQTQESITGEEAGTDEDTPGQEQSSSTEDSKVQDRLEAIADVVTQLNVDDVSIDDSREAVVVDKLGEQYVIDTDGSVTADDLLAQRLETAIAEQLDE